MESKFIIRSITHEDFNAWLPLWDSYNAFYGRSGDSALPIAITRTTWQRFFDSGEPMYAWVAEHQGRLVGLVHYLFHRSTGHIEPICYLQDLYTDEAMRGRGVGRALIDAVYDQARKAGSSRVYWLTQESNHTARRLYDKLAQNSGFIVYRKPL